MSVKITTNGGGSLRYPLGTNFKTSLTGRPGFWLGAWFRTPTTFAANGGASFLVGGTPLETGSVTGTNGLNISQAGLTAGTGPARLRTTAHGVNTTGSRMWDAAGVSTANWESMTALANPGTYFMAIGVRDVGGGDFRVFRAVIPRFGAAGDAQVEVGTPMSPWLALVQEWLNQIFIDNLGTASVSTISSAETMIEHVAIIEGAFPFVSGAPDTSILAGLVATGGLKYDSPSVLNGGTITEWRPLLGISDTTGTGTTSTKSTPLTVRGVVVSGDKLAPWATMTIAEEFDGYTFEGINGPAVVTFGGERQAGQTIQYEIGKTDSSVYRAFGTTGLTYPTSTSWLLTTTAPVNPSRYDYRLSIRDTANPTDVVTAVGAFGVGFVLPDHDQSTIDILLDNGKPPLFGSFTEIAPNNVRFARSSNRSGPGAQFQVARANTTGASGSGYMAMADQIGLDLGPDHPPIMIVNVSAEGQPITNWNDDEYRSGNPANWRLWTGYMQFMAIACKRRATAIIRTLAVPPGGSLLEPALDTFAGLYDSMWSNNANGAANEIWLAPPSRGNLNGSNAARERTTLKAKAATGGRWKLFAYFHDIKMDSNGSHHQAAGELGFTDAASHNAGNKRFGRKRGRAVARMVQRLLSQPVTLDVFGPQVTAINFTSSGKTAFDVTFDRAIETPSGATTNLPQHYISTDGGTAWTEVTANIVGPQTVRITKASGDWIGATLRYDYLRDTPWQIPPAATGADSEFEIDAKLDRLIYDTSTFEGGRGIHAAPIGGIGFAVADSLGGGAAVLAGLGVMAGTRSQPAAIAGPVSLSGLGILAPSLSAAGAISTFVSTGYTTPASRVVAADQEFTR